MCSLECYGSHECCRVAQGGGQYCLTETECMGDPKWQAIVIPAVIFLFALCVLILIIYKCCTASKRPMQVTNFARQEIRMQSKPTYGRFETLTSIS